MQKAVKAQRINGLDEAVVPNALGKLLKLGFVKGAPWVSGGLCA
jgi:hypothetical protein